MPSLPEGTVTFLFTDIEGSTRRVQELGERFGPLLDLHHSILRRAIAAHKGVEVSTEGDAFFAVFPSAIQAVKAAVDAQRELTATEWPVAPGIQVRMGLHTGEAELGGDNYIGVDVNRAARIAAAGHGGQVLLSEPTRALVEPSLPEDVTVRDLGQHRLKDLRTPEHLSQLVIGGLPAEFPALRTLDASRTNIVPPDTPLIGRDDALADLLARLASARLLTLTGPGGIGKSRLALELGSRALGRFGDGVFFVPLETLTEQSLVAVAVAHAIGARQPGQGDPEEAVLGHLADRQMLLILDNVEQLMGIAPFVARLLAGAARLRIVVTSRIPLHLSTEQEVPIPPLAVPDADASMAIESLSRVAAVALFVERARRVRPEFELTRDNAAAVAAICRAMDGLALAIELAAARVKVLTPATLLARLEHALPMLSGGSVDLPARQRTLRATIEWSSQLLDAPQQALFNRLTVFSGGWTADAAEQVIDPAGELGLDILDGLSALVDQSLVLPAPDDRSDETRFWMLRLIREYGSERLAGSGEAGAVMRRHAGWVLAFVEPAGPALEAGDPATLDRLSREHDNLRVALQWCVQAGEQEIGLRIATASWRFWQLRGHLLEGREWFARLLPADGKGAVDPGALAAAYTALGGIAYWQNDLDEAARHYQSALDLDRRLGRSDRLGDDVYNLAFVAMSSGNLDAAREGFAQSADLFVAAGQPARLADTTGTRGAVELRAGNLEAARTWMEEARRLQLARGNRRRATDNAMVLAYVDSQLGDASSAREWLLVAMADARELGDVGRWPLLLEVGISMALAGKRTDDAVRLAGASVARRAKLGGGPPSFLPSTDHVLTEARTRAEGELGADETQRLWTEGSGLDDYALTELLGGLVGRAGS